MLGLAPKDLPIGSSSRKNLRTNASFTKAIFFESAVSSSEITRPRKIGVATASKYPAVTRFQEEKFSSLSPGGGCPSTQTPDPQPPPGGEYRDKAAEATPGMFSSPLRMRR